MDSISRDPESLLDLAILQPELAQWHQAHPPPQTPQDLPSLRSTYEQMNQRYLEYATSGLSTDISISDSIVKSRDDYEIPIRIYRTATSTTPGPLIIAIHGGARVMGTLTDEEAHCQLFAKRYNATCINIGYRLAPEYKSPIMVYDCWDVVQWAAKHANQIGADLKKGFIVQGSSAGAQMADIMAHLSRDENLEPPITGVLEICTSTCQYDAMPEEYKPEYLSWGQDIKGGLSRETLLLFYQLTGAATNPSNKYNSPLL